VNKSKALSIVFIIASIALLSWTALIVAAQTGLFRNKGNSWCCDSPSIVGVTKNKDYYKISFAYTATNYSRELQNIIINPREETVTGITGFINGTVVTGTNPVFKYLLQANDTLQVDLMLPRENFSSGTTVEVVVFGNCSMAGGTVLLP
jgi:hypothetical protein